MSRTPPRPSLAFLCIAAGLLLGGALSLTVGGTVETVGVDQPGVVEPADRVQQRSSASRARPARPACPIPASPEYFWAAGTFRDDDAFERTWYSSHLRAMQEASLTCDAPPRGETYRFLWLRSFQRPVAVRLNLWTAGGTLTAVELSGRGGETPDLAPPGYPPQYVVRRFERALTAAEVESIRDDVVASGFWGMVTKDEALGCDGAQWILEAQVDGTYHVVDRWSPTKGRLRDLCLRLLQMGGVDMRRPGEGE